MLKGKATIQLINAETGQVEYSKIENNMITNGINNLLNPTGLFDLFCNSTIKANYLQNYTPIRELIGGIMLFSREITEEKNNIIPSSSLITDFTGCANIEFAGDSTYRGTLNTSESGEIEKGYRWTWDFGTNCANGGISSICLSSQSCNLDKSAEDTSPSIIFSEYGWMPVNTGTFANGDHQTKRLLPDQKYLEYGDFLGFEDERTYLFVRYEERTNEEGEKLYGYVFSRVRINDTIGLNTNLYYTSSLSNFGSDIISKEETFYSVPRINDINLSSPLYFTLEDRKVAVIAAEFAEGTKNLKIYLRHLNVDTGEISETQEFTYADMDYGNFPYLYYSNNKIYVTSRDNKNLYIVDTIKDEYINLLLPKVQMKAVKFLDSVIFTEVGSSAANKTLYFLKNDNTFARWELPSQYNNKYTLSNFIFDSSIFAYPLFVVASSSDISNTRINYLNLCTFNPFMISINNISPIVKHQSQVLKVIYEVTED